LAELLVPVPAGEALVWPLELPESIELQAATLAATMAAAPVVRRNLRMMSVSDEAVRRRLHGQPGDPMRRSPATK
jgi:hypothetical protein